MSTNNDYSLEISNEMKILKRCGLDEFRLYLHEYINNLRERMMVEKKSSISTFAAEIENEVLGIFNETIAKKLKLNRDQVYYIQECWKTENESSVTTLSLAIELYNETMRELLYDLSPQPRITLLNSLFKALDSKGAKSHSVIQFSNYYLKDGRLVEGVYQNQRPAHVIRRELDLKNTIRITDLKEFNELLLNLTGGSSKLRDVLIGHLALSLILDPSIKIVAGKMIHLWGDTGTGKSTLFKLISNVFGAKYVAAFKTTDLSERKQAEIINSPISLSDDASKFVKDNVTSMLKEYSTYAQVTFRKLYNESKSIQPLTSIFVNTNGKLQYDDPSGALKRRIAVIETKTPLKKSQTWFNNLLEDDENLNKVASFLVQQSQKYIKDKDLLEELRILTEKETEKSTLEFLEESNPMITFINEYPVEELKGHTVKYVRDLYEQWCDNNVRNQLGITRFNEFMERQCGLKRARGVRVTIPLEDNLVFEKEGKQMPERPQIWSSRDED